MNAQQTKYGAKGFDVLAFPCNNFGLQEPGENNELLNGLKYVRPGENYVPNFKVSSKVNVNGPDEHPLFTFLKKSCPQPKVTLGDPSKLYWKPIKQTDITWNFEKFLIDRQGKPYKRYVSALDPMELSQDIERLLNQR